MKHIIKWYQSENFKYIEKEEITKNHNVSKENSSNTKE